MRLDTHVHTSPGSRCSAMEINSYLECARDLGLRAICITNHGNMEDFDRLAELAPKEMVVIPGVEISSVYGDFLIYSTDHDFLRDLEAAQPLPERGDRPDESAVIWAHPFAGSAGGALMDDDFVASVAPKVEAIEVYNGNWPDDEASKLARRVAARYGLAEMGGSDAHRRENLLRCWTEVGEVSDPAGLISAIKARKTKAVRKAELEER